LGPLDVIDAPKELINGIFEAASVLGDRRWFSWRLGSRFDIHDVNTLTKVKSEYRCIYPPPGLGFDHDVKVDEFLRKAREFVGETKGVLADGVGGEDVVSSPLALACGE
jgi:hypothetical protein